MAVRLTAAIDRAKKQLSREMERQRAQREQEILRAFRQNARERAARERQPMVDAQADWRELQQEAKAAYESRCAERADLCKKYVNRAIG